MSLAISRADVTAISNGASRCMSLPGPNGEAVAVVVARDASGALRAALNSCLHMGASFAPATDVEDAGKLKCTMHGWLLDPTTMTYVESSNPQLLGIMLKRYEPGTKQPELVVTMAADGSASLALPEGASSGGGCSLA